MTARKRVLKPAKSRQRKQKAAPSAAPKPKIGRPSTYRPSHCDTVRKLGLEGWSVTATAGHLGTNRQVFSQWAAKHPEFADALQDHKAFRAKWWETQARAVANGGGAPGQATICIFGLKNANAEEWRDVQHQQHEHAGKGGGPIQYQLSPEVRDILNETLRELGQPLIEPPAKGNGQRKSGNGATRH